MTEIFITCPEHLEGLLVQELKQLKVRGVHPGFRGVFAPQTLETVYTVNYLSRLATRVLWPLAYFECRDKISVYEAAKKISWLPLLDEKKTFAIDANVTHPSIRNSLFGAQVMKDGLCDHIRERRGERPSVNVKEPDVQLNLFIHRNKGIISLDTSGSPLFKRGWRTESSVASIQENLAAALLIQSGYTADTILCDPFCGSGTFLIEAAMMATRTPAGFYRKQWGFFHLPQHDAALWEQIKTSADQERTSLAPGLIFGADKDREALEICRSHVRHAGFEPAITVQKGNISQYLPPKAPNLVISNPPYGKRLDTSIGLYREIGAFLKSVLKQKAKAVVLAPNRELIRATQLPIRSTFSFNHGGLPITAFSLDPRA